MKDIIDRYEESKFPALLEVLFIMILTIDFTLAIWVSFMASLHIDRMPYLNSIYIIVIPIAYIFPLVNVISIKKSKKHLLRINNTYLLVRVIYLTFFFINEVNYRLAEAANQIDKVIYANIVNSGVLNISCVFIFSVFWIITINLSKTIKKHISS
jgi:hypothetical protein